MATTETYAPNRLYTIPLAELMPDPNQPQKFHDLGHSNPFTGKKGELHHRPEQPEAEDRCATGDRTGGKQEQKSGMKIEGVLVKY